LAVARVAGCPEPDLEMILSTLFHSTSVRRRTDTVQHASKVAGSAQRNPTAFRRTSNVQQQNEQSKRRLFQRISKPFRKVELPPCNIEPMAVISQKSEKQDTQALSPAAISSNSLL
jgi:hypothetical protein